MVIFLLTYDGTAASGDWSVPDVTSLRDNRSYVLLAVGGVFVGATVFSTVGYTLLYADEEVGVSAVAAGVILAGVQVTGSLGRLGATMLGSTGVYYSCLTGLVGGEEVGAATAGGQTAINVGGLLVPPAFGYLADTAGYDSGWLLLAGCCAVLAAVVVAVWQLDR